MLKIYTDRDQSADFLTDIQNEDICLIISEEMCQYVVPLIHDFNRLQHIFILRKTHKISKHWIQNWSKIKGIYADISNICDIIRQTEKQCEQNAPSFNLLSKSDDQIKKNPNRLDPMFMYSQILVQIILEIEFEEEHFKEFIDYCRDMSSNNDAELKNIERFQNAYHTKSAIEWYTSEYFLYSTLNRGLRSVDVDTIIKMGCFITNLYRQIAQLHEDQYPKGKINDHFIVYRGQVTSRVEFEKIKQNVRGLIAFNSFISTTKNSKVSSMFAGDHQISSESVSTLFIITVDPEKTSVPFASIKDISQFPEEDEILFVLNAVFRINHVESISKSPRHFKVELRLTNDTDQDLALLQQHTQNKFSSSHTGWEKLTTMLLDMGHAEQVQQTTKNQSVARNTENNRLLLYLQLGTSHFQKGEYDAAIQYFERLLEIQK